MHSVKKSCRHQCLNYNLVKRHIVIVNNELQNEAVLQDSEMFQKERSRY